MSATTTGRALINCVQLMSAARRAGLDPVAAEDLHAIAYLAGALGPIWNLPPVRDILKRVGLPFLPEVQDGLDHLVFSGVIEVESLRPWEGRQGIWSLRATFRAREPVFTNVWTRIATFPEERDYEDFLLEIAFGLARAEAVPAALLRDAAYADPTTSSRELIELGIENPSVRVADYFGVVAGEGTSAAQKVALYLSLLDDLAEDA